MAILIVDDETQTREALRELLSQLAHHVILEAKNGLEATKILQSEKSRIRMIIADLNMPLMDGLTLALSIAEQPIFHLTPFLLISSQTSHLRLTGESKLFGRVDHWITKPFRIASLAKAMTQAFIHRVSLRNQILYIGKKRSETLNQFLILNPNGTWKSSHLVPNSEGLPGFLGQAMFQMGTFFIDPEDFTESEKEKIRVELQYFKKTPRGVHTPLICLSRDPKETFHFRTLCQLYEEKPKTAKDWEILLRRIQQRNQAQWDLDLLFCETKRHLQNGKPKTAWKTIEKMLKLDPHHPWVHCMAGDTLHTLNKTDEAIFAYQKALQLNPNLPKPYFKLLSIIQPEESNLLSLIAENAIQFCPQNFDIFLAAAQALLKSGNEARAKEIVNSAANKNSSRPKLITLLGKDLLNHGKHEISSQ